MKKGLRPVIPALAGGQTHSNSRPDEEGIKTQIAGVLPVRVDSNSRPDEEGIKTATQRDGHARQAFQQQT